LQVAEFEEIQGVIRPNILYRWIPEGDKMIKHAESSSIFEMLAKSTGRSQNEIQADLATKREIIDYLVKNKIRDLTSVGKIMNYYYTNREALITGIKTNNVKKILEE